jgi:hypothetical protein
MSFTYKIWIFFIGLMLIMQCHIICAQNPVKQQKFAYNVTKTPTFGLKGGILLSTISGDEAINKYAKNISPQIGITGAFYFTPQFSVLGELDYEGKGGVFENHDMKTSLQYLSLPVYLKFNFTKDPEIYIYGGGYASYLLAAKTKGTYEISIGNEKITESIDEDILLNLNKFDAGIVVGLGVQGRFNNQMDIFLDFRYTLGFLNLDNGTAEYRYNFNYVQFWPEKEVDNPTNKALMLTTGIIYYLDSR